jgi:signal peptidase II
MKFNFKNIQIQKKTAWFIALVVFFALSDRFLKALCLKGYFDRPIRIFGDILTLNYVKNYHIAFSIPFSGPILTGVIGLTILILLFYLMKLLFSPSSRPAASNLQKSLTILIIGAILNFTDRIRFGYVIDYFDLKYFTVFNLADVMISGGVFTLLTLNIWGMDSKAAR